MFDSSLLKRLLTLCLACLFGIAGSAFAAPKVLLLTTAGDTAEITNPLNYLQAFSNLETEFTNEGALVTRNDVLLATPPGGAITTAIGSNTYDIVVIASTYTNINSGAWTELQSAIASRAANSFLFFVDTVNTVNTPVLVSTVNAISGWSTTPSVTFPTGVTTFPLNTLSPYQSDLSGLNPITGGWLRTFSNTPAANSVYLANGAAPIGSGVTDAYTLLIPASQSFGGAGACTIVTGDMSGLDSVQVPAMYTGNQGKFGKAFMNLSRNACGLPSVAMQFSPASLSAVNAHSTLILTVSNPSTAVGGVSNVALNNTLPANLSIGSGGVLGNTCGGTATATVGGTSVALSGGSMSAATAGAGTLTAATCTLTVDVQWTGASCSSSVTNTITPPTNFSTGVGQLLAPVQASLLCNNAPPPPPANATPVPGLRMPALLALIALLGLVIVRQQRRLKNKE